MKWVSISNFFQNHKKRLNNSININVLLVITYSCSLGSCRLDGEAKFMTHKSKNVKKVENVEKKQKSRKNCKEVCFWALKLTHSLQVF